MFRVLVADAIKSDGLTPFKGRKDLEVVQKKIDEVQGELHSFDALLVRSATKVTEDLLLQMSKVKIVARAGVGVDNIDVSAATKLGIIVVNAPDGNTISTAEHTFAMMAALVRQIPQAHQSVKNHEWKRNQFVGTELSDKTLGIVGMGRIGSEITKRAKAFNMTVLAFDPFLTSDRAEKMGIKSVSLDELLANSTIITVHTPLTKETTGLINRDNIYQCQKGSYLINCARGGIIDEDALYEAIKDGHIAGAALDVFTVEPPEGNRLLDLPQVITTPHLGASTKEAQLNVATQVAKEVILYIEGKPVSNSINLPSISKELFETIQPYYQLVKQMGRFLSQFVKEGIREVSVTYGGDAFSFDTSVLTKSLLSGLFKNQVDVNVNEVNALMFAKERGVTIGKKISDNTFGYANCISVTIKGETRISEIKGTYINKYGPRIVGINGFDIDFYPTGNLLYIQHIDRPGVIGRVGKYLGDHDVNIATMQVGRKEMGGEAIMVLTFDHSLSSPLFEELQAIDDITIMQKIQLA